MEASLHSLLSPFCSHFLNALGAITAIVDTNGRYLLASSSWRSLFCIDEGVTSLSASHGVPEGWRETIRSVLEGAEAPPPQEFHLMLPDGSTQHVRCASHPWRPSGGTEAVVLVVTTITDVKRGEIELARQQRFLRQVIDTDPNFVFAKDREGRFTIANRALAEAYGSTPEALVGKRDVDFNPRTDEVERFRRDDLEVMDTGQEKFTGEEAFTDSQNRTRYMQTMKRPIHDEHGRITQVLGVSTDITRRKQLEEELAMSKKLEAIGRLAGGVAHDFNNLLTVILGFTDLALQRIHNGRGVIIPPLQKAFEAAQRAQQLTRQLLVFGRKQKLELKVVDLNEEIRTTHRMLHRLIGEHIEMELWLDPLLARICADSTQIHQMLVNLAINARDAMPDGGKIIFETGMTDSEHGVLSKAGSPELGTVYLRFSDTGTGIPPEVLPHIFDPFFTTKEQGHGTGLGLSIVYGIVKQHGGDIHVRSHCRAGTTFEILLPAATESAKSPVIELEPSPPAAHGGESILVVEDEDLVRLFAHEVLAEHGYSVTSARDGLEALEIVKRQHGRFDLMISDVIMPKLNGPAFYERVSAIFPEIPILFISGYTGDVLAQQGLDSERTNLIHKPFNRHALLMKVHLALSKARKLAVAV